MTRRKGVYYVTQVDCLIPGSGAYTHIQMGIKELAKEFDIQLYSSSSPVVTNNAEVAKPAASRNNPFKRFLKGALLLFRNNATFVRDFQNIKRHAPDFIFERAAYLNYKGLLIARLLRIPHFYEVNGILWKDNIEFYSGAWSKIAKSIESFLLPKSDFLFFVGGVGNYYNVPDSRKSSVQNGIEPEFLHEFCNHSKAFDNGKIQMIFIGHAMAHHRLDLFTEAASKIANPERFHIHLVGRNLDEIARSFPKATVVSNHGILSHQEIIELLKQCHVGIIPYLRDYFSNVKAFMYAASKLLIVMPLIGNFENVFKEEQIAVFLNESVDDFASTLNSITPDQILQKGPKVFELVRDHYTWDKIFSQVVTHINQVIDARTSCS